MNQQLPLKNNSEKFTWANNLRSIATIGVMMLHVASPVNDAFGKISPANWWIGNLLGVTTRWCVPIFIMLSGSFALKKYDGNLKLFFTKTFKRLVLPFLFWSVFYLLFYNSSSLFSNQLNLLDKVQFILKEIVSGTAVHLWFVCMIISMYAIFPFVSKLTNYCSNKEILLFLICWFVYLTLEPFTENISTDFDFTYFSGFIGYLILGNYLSKLTIQPNKILLYLILVGSYLFTAYGTFFLTQKNNELNESLLRSLSPNIIIFSATVYLLFKNASIKLHPAIQKFSNLVCEHSFGIFLVHIFVLLQLNKYGVQYSLFNPILSIPFITLLCFCISLAIVYLLKKIPVLKTFIG